MYREAPSPKGVAVSELTNALHVLDGKWAKLHLLDTDGNCLGSGKVTTTTMMKTNNANNIVQK